MQLSDQQKEILKAKLTRGTVTVINAGAGCGKSTALREIARAHSDKKFLYLVFNRDAKREGNKLGAEANLDNMVCKTVHGLCYDKDYAKQLFSFTGWGLGRYYKGIGATVSKKHIKVVRMFLDKFVKGAELKLDESVVTKESILELIDVGMVDTMDWQDYQARVIADCRDLYAISINKSDTSIPISFDGLIKKQQLLAYKNKDVSNIFKNFDVVLLDEAQDQNPTFSSIIELCVKVKGPAVVMVGDPRQSLYTWRGAVNTIETMIEKIVAGDVSGTVYGLSVSFRFGHDVAELANKVLNYGSKEPMFPIQGVTTPKKLSGKVYLSRTNSRLFGLIADMLESDPELKIYLAGTCEEEEWSPRKKYNFSIIEDIHAFRGEGWSKNALLKPFGTWYRLVHAMNCLNSGKEIDMPEEIVSEDMDADAKRLAQDLNESTVDSADANEIKAFYNFYVQHGVGILKTMEEASVGPGEADVSFSTAHKAKGLEWDTVFIMDDFPMIKYPFLLTNGEAIDQSEVDLMYVAVTRGQKIYRQDGSKLDFYALEDAARAAATERWLTEAAA